MISNGPSFPSTDRWRVRQIPYGALQWRVHWPLGTSCKIQRSGLHLHRKPLRKPAARRKAAWFCCCDRPDFSVRGNNLLAAACPVPLRPVWSFWRASNAPEALQDRLLPRLLASHIPDELAPHVWGLPPPRTSAVNLYQHWLDTKGHPILCISIDPAAVSGLFPPGEPNPNGPWRYLEDGERIDSFLIPGQMPRDCGVYAPFKSLRLSVTQGSPDTPFIRVDFGKQEDGLQRLWAEMPASALLPPRIREILQTSTPPEGTSTDRFASWLWTMRMATPLIAAVLYRIGRHHWQTRLIVDRVKSCSIRVHFVIQQYLQGTFSPPPSHSFSHINLRAVKEINFL